MWMKFPKGAEAVTVQQQPFVVEAKDKAGGAYTRVPENFVAHLVPLGFTVEDPPETDLPDLAPVNPDAKKAVKELALENEGLRREKGELMVDNDRLRASSSAAGPERYLLTEEKASLQAKFDELLAETSKTDVGALQAELADAKTKLVVAQENLAGIQQTLADRGIDLSQPPSGNGKNGK